MKISILIVNKNEEKYIRDCLESAKWADEIVILDTGSTDRSLEIAKEYNAKIFFNKGDNFAAWRTEILSKAKSDWVFYLDSDERITPLLKNEILKAIESNDKTSYFIPRRNFLLGRELKHGGWYPDYVKRIFFKKDLKGWKGELHEEPIFEGETGILENSIIHFQPSTIEPALKKSIKWSSIEAKLIFESNHPPIVWWRVIRMGLTTLFDRLIKKAGYLDGVEGFIESIYQAFHTMLVYIKVWEMQRSANSITSK